MKKIECPNCASANFNDIGFGKYICQYCGTVVQEDDTGNILKLEVVSKPVDWLMVSTTVTKEAVDNLPGIADHIVHEISNELASGIAPRLQIEREFFPRTMSYKYTARIGVVV